MSYNLDYDSASLKAVNEFRKSLGLQEIKKEEKPCLSCNRKFVGFGNHQRLCPSCRQREEV
jgi:hypothetical protein